MMSMSWVINTLLLGRTGCAPETNNPHYPYSMGGLVGLHVLLCVTTVPASPVLAHIQTNS